MIVDTSRPLPETWTDDLCIDLFHHARELGQNGNPGGYVLTVQVFPFVGATDPSGHRFLKPESEWDFDGMRAWIAENLDDVRASWRREVANDF